MENPDVKSIYHPKFLPQKRKLKRNAIRQDQLMPMLTATLDFVTNWQESPEYVTVYNLN